MNGRFPPIADVGALEAKRLILSTRSSPNASTPHIRDVRGRALRCQLHLLPLRGGKVEHETAEGFELARAVVALRGLGRAGDRVDHAEAAQVAAVDEVAQDR